MVILHLYFWIMRKDKERKSERKVSMRYGEFKMNKSKRKRGGRGVYCKKQNKGENTK